MIKKTKRSITTKNRPLGPSLLIKKEQKEEKKSMGFAISDLAVLISLIAVFLYTSGWSFVSTYYQFFELGLLGLDIPKEYFFQYGFWVVQDFWWIFATLYLLFGLGIIVRERVFSLNQDTRRFRTLLIWLLFGGIGLALWGSIFLGQWSAESRFYIQQKNGYPNYPPVQIELKPEVSQVTRDIFDFNSLKQGEYRLFLQNRTHLYLFFPDSDAPEAKLPLLTLPWKEIHSSLTLPTPDLKSSLNNNSK